MKKIYTIIAAAAISLNSFAQSDVIRFEPKHQVKNVKSITKNSSLLSKTSLATGGDTVGRTTDFLPLFVAGNESLYGSSAGGNIFGKNGDSLNACAQYYQNINNTTLKISKIVLMVADATTLTPGSNSTVRLTVYSGAANKAYHAISGSLTPTPNAKGPNAALSTATINMSVLQTAAVSAFAVISLPSQITVTGDFVIGLDSRYLANGDTVGFVSDKKLDGGGLGYALQRRAVPMSSTLSATPTSSATSFVWILADDMWTSGMDVNIAAFAVLDLGTAVNEYYNGVKLNAIFPNPATTNATINYSLEQDSKNVSLVVYDLTGKKVYDENFDNQSAGNYSINLNTENFTAGNYYYQLKANGTLLTKELVIVK